MRQRALRQADAAAVIRQLEGSVKRIIGDAARQLDDKLEQRLAPLESRLSAIEAKPPHTSEQPGIDSGGLLFGTGAAFGDRYSAEAAARRQVAQLAGTAEPRRAAAAPTVASGGITAAGLEALLPGVSGGFDRGIGAFRERRRVTEQARSRADRAAGKRNPAATADAWMARDRKSLSLHDGMPFLTMQLAGTMQEKLGKHKTLHRCGCAPTSSTRSRNIRSAML